MDLSMLSAFVTVAQTGSFTKAAAQLDSHKAHLSRSLANLERELGVWLASPTSSRPRPTSRGSPRACSD
jgi:DNA-binding transcriptional LysR family regulator